eukprot:1110149-Rhodomonas_salina.1
MFDDTFPPLRSEDQRVYWFYDKAAVTQMCADTFGPGILDSPLQDILNMPLPASSDGFDVDTLYDPLTNAELKHCNVADPSLHDEHPSFRTAIPDSWGESIQRDGDDDTSGDCWGTLDSGGAEQPARLGTKRDLSQCSGPSAGVLKNARRSTFNEAPQPYGQNAKRWWDCEHTAINETSNADLCEFRIGHSINIPFPQEFWPENI